MTPDKAKEKNEILLEAGTNELEVLVFTLAGGSYGVNVAKVREVIRGLKPTTTPGMHESVLGMFNMRGQLIPLVDLGKHLGLGSIDECQPLDQQRIIVMEFNGRQTGFVVESVEQIYRISWQSMRPAPELSSFANEADDTPSSCTGVLELGDRLVMMIDFESIADAITLEEKLHVTSVENPENVDRGSYRVLLADDSTFIRTTMLRVFRESGYTQIESYSNGLEAWQAIEANLRSGGKPFDCIVSDIEMPQMDGLALTRRVREQPTMSNTPVILFSSLIYGDNLNKGEQVGATMQLAKPELAEVVRVVDKAVTGQLTQSEHKSAA
ncbi:MAG: chemotaxis protein CheV [Planctomycetota bacterium]|nr:MAG: chemotaxis protein CheV [Planctomycetota bacterium]